jgi:hypothetical protein
MNTTEEQISDLSVHRDTVLKSDLSAIMDAVIGYSDETAGAIASLGLVCLSPVTLGRQEQQALRTLRSRFHDLAAQQAHLLETWHQVHDLYLVDVWPDVTARKEVDNG